MSASGESSTTMHRLLHASGSHPIPPPNDPNTNQYNQDLGLIHSTNGNHLESPNEGSSIDHQVTIYLRAQNITMFPTNETWKDPLEDFITTASAATRSDTPQAARTPSHQCTPARRLCFPDFSTGRGFDPARGAPGGG
ncbi:thioredoxin family protein [Dorcoceras hygrometricum]|uniref:Thioredoxin family protein n=1 Tax=Dorcoceras hygrometricum TaxID=472368 RepID=A0A2Z7DFC7_9LAMI|nr:thioredoxin family protein [Dorcoceras hygrometricum]